jgi:hypothetical protein
MVCRSAPAVPATAIYFSGRFASNAVAEFPKHPRQVTVIELVETPVHSYPVHSYIESKCTEYVLSAHLDSFFHFEMFILTVI